MILRVDVFAPEAQVALRLCETVESGSVQQLDASTVISTVVVPESGVFVM